MLADYAAMAERLGRLKGSFIPSINDHPAIREIFAAFDIERVEATYSVSKGDPLKASQLIIRSVMPFRGVECAPCELRSMRKPLQVVPNRAARYSSGCVPSQPLRRSVNG
ncbi:MULTISPECIES: hypothetical protein [unclassified Aureimonas]|uniref:hypothetical protein n=1 Tax=unclassified Aureimonas TaxID=2615206 RepID=UPI0012E3EC14|nr:MULTISPECIES: hypothetical protein [unclassified Aureimonas]